MNALKGNWGRLTRLAAVVAAGIGLVSGLSGCASGATSGDSVSSSAEILTASDEPDVRRRARLRLELAVGYFEQGQTKVALDELKQVLALDASFGDAYNLRGLIYMRLNDPRLAEESFRRAVALNPRDADALHNFGWFLCQSGRYPESLQSFSQVLTNPLYRDRAKTFLAQGLCEARSGNREKAVHSLARAYELDAANPVAGYNLALLHYLLGDFTKAQFYIRRLNNSEQANAESFWLGVRVERRMSNQEAMLQLVDQLKRRFPHSRELSAYERGAFDE